MAVPAQTRPAAEENIVTVPFTGTAYEAVREMAQQRKKSVPAAIRDAISFAWYLYLALDQGARVIIERPDGTRETLTKR